MRLYGPTTPAQAKAQNYIIGGVISVAATVIILSILGHYGVLGSAFQTKSFWIPSTGHSILSGSMVVVSVATFVAWQWYLKTHQALRVMLPGDVMDSQGRISRPCY